MGSCELWSSLIGRMRISLLSEHLLYCRVNNITFLCIRERREHNVFRALLKSVPGLEERLMTGSEEEMGIVAELVRNLFYAFLFALTEADSKGILWSPRR
jgi:hypothetical protein